MAGAACAQTPGAQSRHGAMTTATDVARGRQPRRHPSSRRSRGAGRRARRHRDLRRPSGGGRCPLPGCRHVAQRTACGGAAHLVERHVVQAASPRRARFVACAGPASRRRSGRGKQIALAASHSSTGSQATSGSRGFAARGLVEVRTKMTSDSTSGAQGRVHVHRKRRDRLVQRGGILSSPNPDVRPATGNAPHALDHADVGQLARPRGLSAHQVALARRIEVRGEGPRPFEPGIPSHAGPQTKERERRHDCAINVIPRSHISQLRHRSRLGL